MNREIVEILEKIIPSEEFLDLHDEAIQHRLSPYEAYLTIREMKILNDVVKKAKTVL